MSEWQMRIEPGPEGGVVVSTAQGPLTLRRGDDVQLTVTSDGETRVYLRVLDDDERWPTKTLARLEDWLESRGLGRSDGLEILRILNHWERLIDGTDA